MSLRSRSRVKASMLLMRTNHLFIQNYIRPLLNIILRHNKGQVRDLTRFIQTTYTGC